MRLETTQSREIVCCVLRVSVLRLRWGVEFFLNLSLALLGDECGLYFWDNQAWVVADSFLFSIYIAMWGWAHAKQSSATILMKTGKRKGKWVVSGCATRIVVLEVIGWGMNAYLGVDPSAALYTCTGRLYTFKP